MCVCVCVCVFIIPQNNSFSSQLSSKLISSYNDYLKFIRNLTKTNSNFHHHFKNITSRNGTPFITMRFSYLDQNAKKKKKLMKLLELTIYNTSVKAVIYVSNLPRSTWRP